jgi:hypothetical protein
MLGSLKKHWRKVLLCALIAYFSVSVRKIMMIINPELISDPYISAAAEDGVLESCQHPQEHIRIVENVHSFSDVSAVLNRGFLGNGWSPILFKNFLRNPNLLWQNFVTKHENVSLTFADAEVVSFGNVFMRGIKTFGKVQTTLRNVVSNAESLSASNRSLFASFLPFLDSESSKQMLNMTDDELKLMIIDTNFVSNFAKDTVSTGIHSAAPPDSFGVQLAGRKLWIFVPPDIMESFDAVNMGPTVLMHGSEKELLQKMNHYKVAVQEEGDLLFFPPQWGHAVITKAGVNVMCNVRLAAIGKSLLTNARKVVEAAIAKIYLDGAAPFSHAGLNQAQQKMTDFMTQRYAADSHFTPPDSGCKQTWIDMLYR